MNEKLKELLGEQLYNQVKEKVGDTKIDIISNNYIPKNRFDERTEELKLLKEKVAEYEKNSKDVEKMLKDNNELKEAFNKLKIESDTTINKLNKDYCNLSKATLLKEELQKQGAANADFTEFLLSKIDLDVIEIKDGSIKHVEDHIKPLKEKHSNLFIETKVVGNEPTANNYKNNNTTGIKNPFTKEHYNLTEQMKLYSTNRQEYERLKSMAK